MTKPLLKILFGVIALFVFIYIGIPFEIDNAVTESIFRTLSFALIFVLLFLLFKQANKINKKAIRITNYIALGMLAFIFVLGALWNNIWVFERANTLNEVAKLQIAKVASDFQNLLLVNIPDPTERPRGPEANTG